MDVPLTGDKKAKFEMDAGTITKNDIKIPVFEAKVAKDVVLYDQPSDFLNKEKQVLSVDGINGAYISVGSMTKVETTGNWPNRYGNEDDN